MPLTLQQACIAYGFLLGCFVSQAIGIPMSGRMNGVNVPSAKFVCGGAGLYYTSYACLGVRGHVEIIWVEV